MDVVYATKFSGDSLFFSSVFFFFLRKIRSELTPVANLPLFG